MMFLPRQSEWPGFRIVLPTWLRECRRLLLQYEEFSRLGMISDLEGSWTEDACLTGGTPWLN